MNRPPNVHVPRLHDNIDVPLNEVIAITAIFARLDALLAQPGNPIAERLTGLGRQGSNDHLPATSTLPAAPPVTDETSARDYVHGLRARLHGRRTFLEALTDPLPS